MCVPPEEKRQQCLESFVRIGFATGLTYPWLLSQSFFKDSGIVDGQRKKDLLPTTLAGG